MVLPGMPEHRKPTLEVLPCYTISIHKLYPPSVAHGSLLSHQYQSNRDSDDILYSVILLLLLLLLFLYIYIYYTYLYSSTIFSNGNHRSARLNESLPPQSPLPCASISSRVRKHFSACFACAKPLMEDE